MMELGTFDYWSKLCTVLSRPAGSGIRNWTASFGRRDIYAYDQIHASTSGAWKKTLSLL